ncbi:hypothetical protein [Nostoc sp.]
MGNQLFSTCYRRCCSFCCSWWKAVSPSTTSPPSEALTPINFFNFSAFQRTLAISPQFIAGRESNALTEVLGMGSLTPAMLKSPCLKF